MKFKKIILDNIRSYTHEEITIPDGATLFAGDIGSGKTSILLAIEFALFGLQPGQRGSSLLKNGKDEGGVKLEIEIEGKQILLERTLTRGKTISQDVAAITIDGDRREISVTELKNEVLNLLNYPLEFSKKQNVLYRFTVYTPQESMKEIILDDPESRMNTLRHIFGVDKYKKILENAQIIVQKIKEEKKMHEVLSSQLDVNKEQKNIKEQELISKKDALSVFEKVLHEKKFLTLEQKQGIVEIEKKIEEKKQLQQEIEKTQLVISGKLEKINENNNLSKELGNAIEEFKKIKFEQKEIIEIENKISEKTLEKNKVQERVVHLLTQINSLNLKNQDHEKIKSNLARIDLCPTCLQDVDAVYKSNVLNKIENHLSENSNLLKNLTLEKEIESKKVFEIDLEINKGYKRVNELKILAEREKGMHEKEARKDELLKNIQSLERDISLLKDHLLHLKNVVLDFSKFDTQYVLKKKEFEEVERAERKAEIQCAELKKEIEVLTRLLEDLNQRILHMEEIKKKAHYFASLENWLTKQFMPLVSGIERNTMVTLKNEFSKYFAEWFNMLVTESFSVRVSDDFTPIIEQKDFEIDYAYLSGGERTAIALAYRLALNQVINSLLSKIKTRGTIILDEPTDGFSEAQLDKMREILAELNVEQVILVSHEQKIEGFVENVIRFKKEHGVSQIENFDSKDL